MVGTLFILGIIITVLFVKQISDDQNGRGHNGMSDHEKYLRELEEQQEEFRKIQRDALDFHIKEEDERFKSRSVEEGEDSDDVPF
tara:strand:- start:21871 stop:22125 length:255 start_codon:yes stop_codon:yes gene_type:complete